MATEIYGFSVERMEIMDDAQDRKKQIIKTSVCGFTVSWVPIVPMVLDFLIA